MQQTHEFGGAWTQEKLERLRKYLMAYTRIMNKKQYRFAYIDAFAGSGRIPPRASGEKSEPLFPEMDVDAISFLNGSARIALEVKPPFNKYFFIEKDVKKVACLETLKNDYPKLADCITIVRDDANSYLQNLCNNFKWQKRRAVLFLDPFGMQVEWDTLKAIAGTKAIDLWLLFPIFVVNRLLRKDGKLPPIIEDKLNLLFGTDDWKQSFYQTEETEDLLGTHQLVRKVGTFEKIARYFVDRLSTLFVGVSPNPLQLYN